MLGHVWRRYGRPVWLAVLLCLLIGSGTGTVSADSCNGLSQTDCSAIYGNWQNWIPNDGGNSCSSDGVTISTNLKGSLQPNAKTAFAFFVSKGYTAQQSAGLVGNFMQESGPSVDPTDTNSIGAHGIAQWLGGRLTGLRTFAAAQGSPVDNLNTQLNYVIHELNTSEGQAKAQLKQTHTVKDAADAIFTYYERPGDTTEPDREQNAAQVFSQLSGQVNQASIDTTSSDGICSSTGGAMVNCTSATGTEKILCEAKAYDGIYYRWGGGHQGYDAFVKGCPDPSRAPNNHPHGAPSDPTNGGLSGNPSPCATDCSGLVSVATDAAFNQKFVWTVSTLQGSSQWKRIGMGSVKPGDVVTKGNYHIEIVDHLNGNVIFTFGSHETGTKTSLINSSLSSWSGAYHYVGPGA